MLYYGLNAVFYFKELFYYLLKDIFIFSGITTLKALLSFVKSPASHPFLLHSLWFTLCSLTISEIQISVVSVLFLASYII